MIATKSFRVGPSLPGLGTQVQFLAPKGKLSASNWLRNFYCLVSCVGSNFNVIGYRALSWFHKRDSMNASIPN